MQWVNFFFMENKTLDISRSHPYSTFMNQIAVCGTFFFHSFPLLALGKTRENLVKSCP